MSQKDFSKIHRYGRRFTADNLQLQCLGNNQGATRIGFTVGAKFSKKAVERNAIKRKLREIFRQELKNIKSETDIIVSVGGRAGGKESYEALRKKVGTLLKKSSLIKK